MNNGEYTSYLSAPIFVWWDITKVCNFKCKQCYSNAGQGAQQELTTEEVFGILEQLAAARVFYIYFLGGEPLLRRDFFEVLSKCQELGITTMFSTNGWFVTSKTATEAKNRGVQIARVSLDGATPEVHDSIRGKKGSFDRALRAITLLKEAGIPSVGVSPTLMKDNYFQITELADLAIQYGADEVQVVQLCATGRGSKEMSPSLQQLMEARVQVLEAKERFQTKKITATEGILRKECENCVSENIAAPSMLGCSGGRSCAAINEVGDVSPCILFRRFAGSLRADSFSNIWSKSPLFKKMRRVREECSDCNFSNTCGGVCPIVRSEMPRNLHRDFVARSSIPLLGKEKCCQEFDGFHCFIRS